MKRPVLIHSYLRRVVVVYVLGYIVKTCKGPKIIRAEVHFSCFALFLIR